MLGDGVGSLREIYVRWHRRFWFSKCSPMVLQLSTLTVKGCTACESKKAPLVTCFAWTVTWMLGRIQLRNFAEDSFFLETDHVFKDFQNFFLGGVEKGLSDVSGSPFRAVEKINHIGIIRPETPHRQSTSHSVQTISYTNATRA